MAAKDSAETQSLMIRPTVKLLRWYQKRAAEMQLHDNVTITPNKLIVQDLEALMAKADKKGAK